MNKKLSSFFGIDIIDTSIRNFEKDIDIEITLFGGERIRFFIYPETVNFSLSWYGTTAEYADTSKIHYIACISRIAVILDNKKNLLSLIDILRSVECKK